MTQCRQIVEQRRERRQLRHRSGGRDLVGGSAAEQGAQCWQADHVERTQRHAFRWKCTELLRHRGERRLAAPFERQRDGIVAIARDEHRIDHELLVVETERVQFVRAARGLSHRGMVGACHEHDGGTGRIRERGHRGGELVVLHLQPGVRAETRLAVRRVLEKARPRARQAEQPQRVTRRSSVEDDVIPALAIAREQLREPVERGERETVFCSIAIAVERPSTESTSGFSN